MCYALTTLQVYWFKHLSAKDVIWKRKR